MWDLTGLDDLLDAVEALDAGRERAEAVENSIQDALASGVITRGETLQALQSAARRRAAAGMIERLGLEGDGPRQPVAPQSTKPVRAATKSRYSGTRISAGDTVPAGAPPPPASSKNKSPVAARPPQPTVSVEDTVQIAARPSQPPAGAEDTVRIAALQPQPHAAAEHTARLAAPPPQPPEQPAAITSNRRPNDSDHGATLAIDRLMVGQTLGGRYRLERELRNDGLGTVYLAHDLHANEAPFAVNVLRSEFRSFSEALTLLRTEVRVTRMLRHPHIARVYSLNADRLGAYLVTEYLDGRTLDAHLQDMDTGLAVDEARPVVDDVCAALTYAHDLEVVHGNLQPAHVFITPSGRAKLLDFGLERAAGTRNGRFDSRRIGGLAMSYASPEMLEGRAPDPRDDVYSLACIIYTMLSGTHPFDLQSAVEARRLALAMTPLPVLSREQNAAIARGLAFEAAQRTPSVTALLADLGWSTDPQTVSAPAFAAAAPAPHASAPAPHASAPAPHASAPAPHVSASAASMPVPPVSALDTSMPAPTPDVSVTAPVPVADARPTALRAPRRVGLRLPLPPLEPSVDLPSADLPSMHLPSVDSTPRVPRPERTSRRYVIPALIVLALVAVGIGIALVYRAYAPSSVPSQSASSVSPASSPVAPSPAAPVAASAPTVNPPASNLPAAVPVDRPVAAPKPLKPPAVARTQSVSPVQTAPRIAILRALPKAADAMADNDNCPYPRTAVDQGLTGTVFLLVHVASDGKPVQTKMDKSSGSDVLDQAAVRCVEQFGRFPTAPAGSAADGYWGRLRFKWFIGL
jgi:TonB family protein